MIYMGGNVPLTITITDAFSPYSNHSASGGTLCFVGAILLLIVKCHSGSPWSVAMIISITIVMIMIIMMIIIIIVTNLIFNIINIRVSRPPPPA